jgi:hypothetical protein
MPPTGDREAIRAELARELQGLQSAWQQIAQKLTLKVRSHFREIEGELQRHPVSGHPTGRQLRELLSLVRDLRIKPDKARAKDLLRIERLLHELSGVLPVQDD